MADDIDASSRNLPDAFLEGARASALDGRAPPSPENLIAIADDATLRAGLLQLIEAQATTPELRQLVTEYIEETAERLDAEAETTEVMVELFDRAGLPIATAAFLSGLGLLVSLGFAPGPLVALVGGLFGLLACGRGRTILRLRANRSKASARKLRRLADAVKRR